MQAFIAIIIVCALAGLPVFIIGICGNEAARKPTDMIE